MVIYEMLTGRVAFEGDAVFAIINQHLREEPTPPRRLRPDLNISEEIERVVLKALEKDRERRQQTVKQLAEELEAARKKITATSKPAPRGLRSVAALVVTVALLALAALAAVWKQFVP